MIEGLKVDALTTTLVMSSDEVDHAVFVTFRVNEVAVLFPHVVGVWENPAMLSAVKVAENGRF